MDLGLFAELLFRSGIVTWVDEPGKVTCEKESCECETVNIHHQQPRRHACFVDRSASRVRLARSGLDMYSVSHFC